MQSYGIEEIRRIRYEISKDYLQGDGMEVGAGGSPQRLPASARCTYFDKYDKDFVKHFFGGGVELPYEFHQFDEFGKIFPRGADFLIAHNVLEHCENPLATLIEWFGYLRIGGVLVVGLPLPTYCTNDARRVQTPFRHILDDFLFDRTQDDFESREHIYSFRLGWRDDKSDMSKDQYLDFIQDEGLRQGHDIHWHVGGYEYYKKAILAAGYFSRKEIEFLNTTNEPEALFVIRIREDQTGDVPALLEHDLAFAHSQLASAMSMIGDRVHTENASASLRRELLKRESELDVLSQQLHSMRASRSWRMTAPLRELMALARRIRARAARH